MQSGLYYEIFEKNGKKKTRLNYKMYFAQLAVWLIVVIIVKSILLGLQKLCSGFLESFGNSVLSPFQNNGKLKLIMVMILIPLLLNAVYFWLVDNILKLKPDEEGNEIIKEIYIKESAIVEKNNEVIDDREMRYNPPGENELKIIKDKEKDMYRN